MGRFSAKGFGRLRGRGCYGNGLMEFELYRFRNRISISMIATGIAHFASRVRRCGQVSPWVNERPYRDLRFLYSSLGKQALASEPESELGSRLEDNVIRGSRICRSILYTCRYAPTPYPSTRAKASPVVSLRELPPGQVFLCTW